MSKIIILIGAQLLVFSGMVQSQSQDSKGFVVEAIRRAYEQLDYAEAETKANAALREYQRFTPAQLTEIHKIVALVHFSGNKEASARQHFENALSISPDLELDPLLVSPKILDFFERVKETWRAKLGNRDDTSVRERYILVQDPRPSAALRSMILPGWGQLQKGEKTKGRILMALWGLGAAGTVAVHFARADAEDKYLAETNSEKISSRFDTFNRYHKLRNNLLLVTAGIWIFSYLDALIKFKPLHSATSRNERGLSLLPALRSDRPQFRIQLKF